MFKRKTKVGEYARVRMECVDGSMSDNFDFHLELREKLEKR